MTRWWPLSWMCLRKPVTSILRKGTQKNKTSPFTAQKNYKILPFNPVYLNSLSAPTPGPVPGPKIISSPPGPQHWCHGQLLDTYWIVLTSNQCTHTGSLRERGLEELATIIWNTLRKVIQPTVILIFYATLLCYVYFCSP